MKYCRTCGAELRDEAVICPKCGCPTRIYVPQNVNSTALFIAYAASLLLVFCAMIGGMFSGDESVIYTITGITLLHLFIVFFALSASMYLFMSYSITNKKALGALIVIGAVLIIGFCISAKSLATLVESINKINYAIEETKKIINKMLAVSSIIMIGYLISATLAIVTGALGLAGRFIEKPSKVQNNVEEELEEIEE